MKWLFIWFQYLVPHHLLSRCTGRLADLRRPLWLKNRAIRWFVRRYRVDLGEARGEAPEDYASFNEFFTRPLKVGLRPIADAPLVCPADGAVSQLGAIESGRIFQAKGQWFTAAELLGGDPALAPSFDAGSFATIYLSPRDYHRVHMPIAGRLTATRYIPGRLFSVNGVTADRVPRLFARNERLVCHFETDRGPMALVLVGAMVVAGIETVWAGQVTPPRGPRVVDHHYPPGQVALDRGEELGRFKLGSTVILLFPPGAVRWDQRYGAGSPTRLGEPLAH